MRLYLMRHAEADMACADDQARPLTDRGVHDAQQMASYLQGQGCHIAHIFHSGKRRAEQTADLIKQAVLPSQALQLETALTGCDGLTPMLEIINSWTEDTLVISHLPFISRLLSRLVVDDPQCAIVNFSPATLVRLEQAEAGGWCIQWCINPQLIIEK